MRKRVKHFLAVMMAVAMVFGVLPLGNMKVLAEEYEYKSENDVIYYYNILDEGEIEVTGCYIPENVTELKIPEIIDGKKVKGIGDYAFLSRENLTAITIPSGITNIGVQAFSGCSSLTGITIPDSVVAIGNLAFAFCDKLTEITIPASVRTIDCAFWACGSLSSIVVEAGNQNYQSINGSLYDRDGTELLTCPAGKESIELPETVTEFDINAFSYHSRLKTIEVANGNKNFIAIDGVLYSIDKTELIKCPPAKEKIEIPKSVTMIWGVAFMYCRNLTSITIPKSVISFYGSGINFAACECLEEINVAEGNSKYKSVDGVLYDADGTKLIKCPQKKEYVKILETVNCISDYAFEESLVLKNVEIPEGGNMDCLWCISRM